MTKFHGDGLRAASRILRPFLLVPPALLPRTPEVRANEPNTSMSRIRNMRTAMPSSTVDSDSDSDSDYSDDSDGETTKPDSFG